MTNYKNHLLGGFLVTLSASAFLFYYNFLTFDIKNVLILLAISFFFPLLPDLDIGTSLIRKVVMWIIGLSIIFSVIIKKYFSIVPLALAIILIQFLHHRKIMHSFFVGVLLSASLYLFLGSWIFPMIAMLNFLSHLIMDMKW